MPKLIVEIFWILALGPPFIEGQTTAPKASKSVASCKSLVADIVLMIDISASVYYTVVENRTFIRNVIDGFPIDGKTMRMGLVVFSTSCKTLVKVEDGTSKAPLYDSLEEAGTDIFLLIFDKILQHMIFQSGFRCCHAQQGPITYNQ
uniref:VWFA domain-containing protein n=1 Tax=Romanomermis culicivorax TaxID=13658 RepID=A0A915IFR4_ROMCU